MAEESLSILSYGPSGAGKTTLGLTGPKPTLVLDAEQASKFIPRKKKITWNPMDGSHPPAYDGTWEYCIVRIDSWDVATKVMDYLRRRDHPFKTILLDSVTEILTKAKEDVNGRNQFQIQHWGRLAQNLSGFLRDLRDETSSDKSPIRVLDIIAAEKSFVESDDKGGTVKEKKIRPLLEGSVKDLIPYLYDMTVRITLDSVPVDPSNPGKGYRLQQSFFTGRDPEIIAKSRTPIPPTIYDPTLIGLLKGVFLLEEDEIYSPEELEYLYGKPEDKKPNPPVEAEKPAEPKADNNLPTLP